DGPQHLGCAPVVAEGVTGQPKVMARVELEREISQLVAQGERLLGKGSRLSKPPSLAEVFGGVDGDQAEPAGIGDRARHSLGFPKVAPHLLELAKWVERATKLEAHIDILLSRLWRLGQVA